MLERGMRFPFTPLTSQRLDGPSVSKNEAKQRIEDLMHGCGVQPILKLQAVVGAGIRLDPRTANFSSHSANNARQSCGIRQARATARCPHCRAPTPRQPNLATARSRSLPVAARLALPKPRHLAYPERHDDLGSFFCVPWIHRQTGRFTAANCGCFKQSAARPGPPSEFLACVHKRSVACPAKYHCHRRRSCNPPPP